MDKLSVSSENWQRIEENLLTTMASVKFKIADDEIHIARVAVKENRTALAVYINNKIVWKHGMQSDEQPELIRKVWRKRTIASYSPAKKKKIIEDFGKRNAMKYFPNLDKATTYYDPMFNTAKSLVRQFKKLDGLVVVKIGFEELQVSAKDKHKEAANAS